MSVLDEALAYTEVTWVADPEMLLSGEDPASSDIRDAIHWIQAYGELIGMTSAMLERSEPAVRGVREDAVSEAAGTQRVLRAQRQHYQARYDFWRDRATALNAPTA